MWWCMQGTQCTDWERQRFQRVSPTYPQPELENWRDASHTVTQHGMTAVETCHQCLESLKASHPHINQPTNAHTHIHTLTQMHTKCSMFPLPHVFSVDGIRSADDSLPDKWWFGSLGVTCTLISIYHNNCSHRWRQRPEPTCRSLFAAC